MSRDTICDDIKNFLISTQSFTKKSEVVYLLSEIRKVIENNKHSNLKFYCNWVLHSRLDYKSTVEILSSKLDKHIDFSKSESEIQEMIRKADDGSFIKMADFKAEIKQFLIDYGLPDIFNDRNWRQFRKLYLEIVHKCPIRHGSSGISGLYLSREKDGYYYGFYINKIVRIPRIRLKL